MLSGEIPVSLLLLIFSPPTSSHPCANTFFGNGNPAAISMAGQYTAWKRRMSLPTKCTSAGQIESNFCSSSPYPMAVT